MTKLKEISESPWLRVVNFLLLVLISSISYSFVTAKGELRDYINRNKEKIEVNEDKIVANEKDILTIQTDFRYIKEKLDEISTDIKEFRSR